MPEDPLSMLTGGLFRTSGLELVTQGFVGGGADSALHPRTRIREYVVELLRAAATEAADRVYAERTDPFHARTKQWHLPALNVFARDETDVEIDAESPRVLVRTFELVIDIKASGARAEIHLENIAWVIEQLIGPDRFLGGRCDDIMLGPTLNVFDAESAAKIGVSRMVFLCTYRSEVVQQVGDALTKLHVKWDLGPEPDGQIEAEDELELEGS